MEGKCCLQSAFMVFVGLFCLCNWIHFRGLVEGFQRWGNAVSWVEVNCSVITAGVNCMDKGDICSGYGSHPHVTETPIVFTHENIAVCPGTYYCSKEGEECTCTGAVTYAPQLMDGTRYVGDMQHRERIEAHGVVMCNNEYFGGDPFPGQTKHCWCTPQLVLDALPSDIRTTMLELDQCNDDTNSQYDQDMAGVRRLAAAEGSIPQDEANDDLSEVTDDAVFLDGGDIEDEMGGREPRRLSHMGRRRRTFVYTPWAYVELQPPLTSNQAPKHVCAYQYGATKPTLEFEDFDSSGAEYGLNSADSYVQTLAQNGICWVRHISATCDDVALEDPAGLAQRSADRAAWSRNHGWFFFICGCLLFGFMNRQEKHHGYTALAE